MKPTLRLKLVGFTFGIVLFVGGTISLHSIYQGREHIVTAFGREARNITEFLAQTLLDDLYLLDVRSLRLQLESARVNRDIMYTVLMDGEGAVLTDGTRENALRDQKLTDAFSGAILRSKDWIAQREKGAIKIGGPVRMPDGSRIGYLNVGFSLERVDRIARETTRWSLYLTLLSLGIGAILAFIVAAGLSRPISAITQAANDIGEGKLEIRVQIKRGDELGVLAEAINQMAARLDLAFAAEDASARENARLREIAERRTEELAAVLQATHTVMAGLDLQEMLGRIVGEAAQIAGTLHAKVLLMDRDAQVLRLGAVAGRPSAMLEGLRLPLGTGLSGLVAASGQPLYVPECQHDPRNVYADQDRELGLVTYLGLPIMIRDEVVGVLTFNTTHPRQYSPDELAYLASFAAQAAIAIENARLHEAAQQHAADLEARVKERTAELEEALQVKAQFLANMSHELRTPLNAVLGFSEVLLGRSPGDLTAKQERYLQQIHKGGQRLLELVTDLLGMTEAQTGPASFRLDRLSVRDLVAEMLESLGVAAQAKQVALVSALDPGLPTVVADRHKLAQVLHHLLTNAIRFTPTGGRVTLSARRIGTAEGEEAEIADTGIGIRAEDRERIFRGFEQVDPSDSRQYGGAGLGLALVRRLVELHGGRVWAESEGEGRGARFIVRLPLLAAPPPRRVLVVEDEAHVLEALCTALAAAGYTVDRARTGTEALERLATTPPSLLLLDLGLPDVDGWEVLRRVRRTEQTRDLPILVLTGLEHVHADQALALGADEFLAKPVSSQVLAETVGRLLVRPAREAAPEGQSATSPEEHI